MLRQVPTAYLILHIGHPTGLDGRHIDLDSVIAQVADKLSIHVDTFEAYPGTSPSGRYVFTFQHKLRDDAEAHRIAECLMYAVDLVAGPTSDPAEPSRILPIPGYQLQTLGKDPLHELIELERGRGPTVRTLDHPLTSIGRAVYHTRVRIAAAWKTTPVLRERDNLVRAARYLSESQQDFFVFPGKLEEVLHDDETAPLTGWELSRVETALWNAFRTIEALIGEPHSDRKKFARKLKDQGFDPGEGFGYPGKQPLIDFLYEFQHARDKSSAHGGTPFGPVTVKQLMLYQRCATYLLTSLIEAELGEKLFDA